MVNKKTSNTKKAKKKVVTDGIVHIHASFNNTIISISDMLGNVISWSSAGASGFKGSRKSTPLAAQIATDKAGNKAKESGLQNLKIHVKGVGPGRESSLRTLAGLGYNILSIKDTTPIAHNGCRPPKKRRV